MLRTEYKVLLAIGMCIVCGAIIWQVVENSSTPGASNANFVAAPGGAPKSEPNGPSSLAGRNTPAPRPSSAAPTGTTGITPGAGDRPGNDLAARGDSNTSGAAPAPIVSGDRLNGGLPPLAGGGAAPEAGSDPNGGELLVPHSASRDADSSTPSATISTPPRETAARPGGDSVPTPTTPETIGGVNVPPRDRSGATRGETLSPLPSGVGTPGSPEPAPKSSGTTGTYTVQRGDTLSKIAENYYGDRRQWTKIRDANKGINPDRIREGQVLTLPPKDGSVASARPSKPEGNTASPSDTNSASAPPAGTATTPVVHRVASGETLRALARKYLKSERRWREIYELNRSLLRSPDELEIGMQLKIPPISNGAKTSDKDAKGKSNGSGGRNGGPRPSSREGTPRVTRVP